MARKSKRRRLNGLGSKGLGSEVKDLFQDPPLSLATEEEKRAWQGWCELESEPALFNVMLREFGVKGVRVQEVWSMDDACLDSLPRPVYGLMFLFRWIEEEGCDDADAMEEMEEQNGDIGTSDSIWFANQVADNSCASVALINLIFNHSESIALRGPLRALKDSTTEMDPFTRGVALAECGPIRAIHNSFARKMDMLASDLTLRDETAKSKKKSKAAEVADQEASFHFIAFVPANGKVWKFDGYDNEPQDLGAFGHGDWLETVRPALQSRMMAYETNQIEFSLLSVVRDASTGLRDDLANNVKALNAVWAAFEGSAISSDPMSYPLERADFAILEGVVWTAASEYGLDKEAIEIAEVPEALTLQIAHCTSRADFTALLDHLSSSQFRIRDNIIEVKNVQSGEENLGARRRHDYGPAVFRWLQMLHQKDELSSLLAEARLD